MSPQNRNLFLAEVARRGAQPLGGHPAGQPSGRLLGGNEFDGISGRVSQTNVTRDGFSVSDGRYVFGTFSNTYTSPDLVEEIRVGDLLRPSLCRPAGLEQVEERYQEQEDDGPKREIPEVLVHSTVPEAGRKGGR